jgi:hypothetical protein
MLEVYIIAALTDLVNGRVWPLVAPMGTGLPFITFQQVGGATASSFCGETARPNARMQINVWSRTALETTTIMLAAETALTSHIASSPNPPLRGVALGAFVAEYDETTSFYGARQDFSFWR